jgi:hypothetical protein
MDWIGIVTLVATTGILSALLTQLLTGIREGWAARRRTRAQAGYHALRLAVVLEAYANMCAAFLAKNSNAQTRDGEQFPDWDITLPKLPPYPEDAEGWHAIDLKLAARALNLRNRIDGSQGVIHSSIEYTEDELEHDLDEQAAARGLEAWDLAVAFRRKHGLEQVDLVWDYVEGMRATLASAIATKKEIRERSAALMAAGAKGTGDSTWGPG